MTVPNGFEEDGMPTGIAFVGQIYGEERLLLAAKALQAATGCHFRHPSL